MTKYLLTVRNENYIYITNAKFDIFTGMKIQVEVLWVVTPCSDVEGSQLSEYLAASIFTLPHHYTALQTHKATTCTFTKIKFR